MSRRDLIKKKNSLTVFFRRYGMGGQMYTFLGVIFDKKLQFRDYIEIRDRINTEKNVSHMIKVGV